MGVSKVINNQDGRFVSTSYSSLYCPRGYGCHHIKEAVDGSSLVAQRVKDLVVSLQQLGFDP